MNPIKENILKEVTDKILDNIDDIFELLGNDEPISLLENLSEHHKDDEEIMLGIMKAVELGPLLSYCSDRLKNDPSFVYETVKIQEQNFSQASNELQNNKDFVLECIQLPTFLIEDAPEHFLDDKDCAIAAIKRKGLHSLKVISDRLKDDKDVAIAAINYQPACYNYISERLQHDKEIVLLALSDEGLMKSIPTSYRDNKEVMLDCFNMKHLNPQGLQNLQYVSERLKNDPEIVISAIKQDGLNLQFADSKFKKDKNLAILAIKNNGSLEFLSKTLKNNKEIVLLALKNNASQLQFASDTLKNDKELVAIACESNTLNIQYASLEIREEIGTNNPVQFIERQKMYNEINKKLPLQEEVKTMKKKI
jgi:hypothetical protein